MSDKSMEIKTFKSQEFKSRDDNAERVVRRRAVLWPANLIVNGHGFPCQIRNLSLGGAKVKLDIPIKEGALVKLEIPSKDILFRSEVVWQSKDTIGLIFLETKRVVRESFGEQADILGLADENDF